MLKATEIFRTSHRLASSIFVPVGKGTSCSFSRNATRFQLTSVSRWKCISIDAKPREICS